MRLVVLSALAPQWRRVIEGRPGVDLITGTGSAFGCSKHVAAPRTGPFGIGNQVVEVTEVASDELVAATSRPSAWSFESGVCGLETGEDVRSDRAEKPFDRHTQARVESIDAALKAKEAELLEV